MTFGVRFRVFTTGKLSRADDCQSATQQIANLRYAEKARGLRIAADYKPALAPRNIPAWGKLPVTIRAGKITLGNSCEN